MDVYITIVSLGELPSCAFSTGRRGEGGGGGAIIWSTWFDSAREGFLKVGSGSRSLVTTSGGGGGENFSVGVISKRKISRGIERNERVKEERKKVD